MQIDRRSLEEAEDAKWASVRLARGGFGVIDPLVTALPTLSPGGHVEAIEALGELEAWQAAGAIIELLDTSPSDFARQWCAEFLGDLQVAEAAPALWRTYRASRARGEPVDLSEPGAVRTALTQIGALVPVVPPRVAELLIEPEDLVHPRVRYRHDVRAGGTPVLRALARRGGVASLDWVDQAAV